MLKLNVLLVIGVLVDCTAAVIRHHGDVELDTRSGGHSHGEETDRNSDMWSMVASMKGNLDSMSVAEYTELRDHDSDDGRFHYDWQVRLDEANKYQLGWSANYGANEVILGLQVNRSAAQFSRGSDVFALGFSSYGQLESSDFCIIWYDLSHQIHLQDARTDAKNRLKLISESQSYCKLVTTTPNQQHSLPQYQEDNEPPTIELARFKRPLDVCDESSEYYRIDNGTTHLVWFTIKGPLLAIDDLDLNQLMGQKQFESGLKRVQLIPTKPSRGRGHIARSLAEDIRMERYEIPGKETTYWCKLFRLPRKFESRKYHITKYEAVIEKGNEHIVHHMELFNCANLNAEQEFELARLSEVGWSGECSGAKRPAATHPCRKVIMAWAMGAHPLEYPEQVGQAIGGSDYSPYVVLEVHYNNVQSQVGLLDSSGLRFHYSAKLRPYDAGVLEVGLEYTDKNSVPPQMVAPLAGYCVGECTRAAMSSSHHNHHHRAGSTGERDGVYIFAAQMHTHLVGVASWTEQVREGRVIGELQRDNHYSPHFQEIRLLPEPVHLAPGDALIHYCLYDTSKRVNITLGGFATSDEMCVTYLHYYPRIDLEVCKSSVDSGALAAYFARLAREEAQPTSAAKSVADNYRSVEWSPRRSEELLEFYHAAPLSVQCNRSNGERYPGFWNGVPPTDTDYLSRVAGPPAGAHLAAYRGRNTSLVVGRHAQCGRRRLANH